MNRLFYTYTLAKTLHERGWNYIDTFWPFVLKALPENGNAIELVSIQEKLRVTFGLDVPEHSLKTIISRAEEKGYIVAKKFRYMLTEEGSKYLNNLEPESTVERRINALLEDIKNYLDEQLELSLDLDVVQKIVLSFVGEYLYPVMEFFKPDSKITGLGVQKVEIRNYEDELVHYFEIAKQRKPGCYNTLQDIVYGSLISAVANSPNINEIDKGFKETVAFLDSNFLFSVLEFHFPEFSKPAKELFDLLKSYKIKIKVFDFTIDEMVSVLRNYEKEQHMYIAGVRVNSIYSSLKSRGWTSEDIRLFIQKIEQKIQKLGLEIESTDIEVKTYEPEIAECLSSILKYAPSKLPLSCRHDVAAIERIKKIRISPKRELESSIAFFLTSDLRLSRFNFEEMGHREKATVCEVIPDRLLTNILWLKNPTIIKDIPLKSIIAVHSHDMFVDRAIWKRFYENIRKLIEEGEIKEGDISMLFYDHQIEKILSKIDESEIEMITPVYILEEVGHVEKKVNKKIELTSKKIAERYVKYVNIGLWIIIAGIIFTLLVLIPRIIAQWNWIEPVACVAGLIVSIITIVLGPKITPKKLKKRLETKLFNKIYARERSKLEDLFRG